MPMASVAIPAKANARETPVTTIPYLFAISAIFWRSALVARAAHSSAGSCAICFIVKLSVAMPNTCHATETVADIRGKRHAHSAALPGVTRAGRPAVYAPAACLYTSTGCHSEPEQGAALTKAMSWVGYRFQPEV